MNRYFKDCSDSDLKRLKKKLKEVQKDTRNGRPRRFFTCAEYVRQEDAFDFLKEQSKSTNRLIKEEKERAWKCLNDEKIEREGGWFDKKPNPQKLEKWAELAYPNINVEYFDSVFEMEMLEKELKERY